MHGTDSVPFEINGLRDGIYRLLTSCRCPLWYKRRCAEAHPTAGGWSLPGQTGAETGKPPRYSAASSSSERAQRAAAQAAGIPSRTEAVSAV